MIRLKKTCSDITLLNSALTKALFAFALLFTSCENKKPVTQYYAVDSLIDAQIEYLSNGKLGVAKISRLGNITDTTFLSEVDSTGWASELDIFRQIDELNKPINKGEYIVSSKKLESQKDISLTSFTSKKKQGVGYLKLYAEHSLSNLRKLEANFVEENSLYKSSRTLTMEFNNINNKTVLTSYAIVGGQKMFSGDTVEFFIRGKVKHSNNN